MMRCKVCGDKHPIWSVEQGEWLCDACNLWRKILLRRGRLNMLGISKGHLYSLDEEIRKLKEALILAYGVPREYLFFD